VDGEGVDVLLLGSKVLLAKKEDGWLSKELSG
jgi:hypothetical protein